MSVFADGYANYLTYMFDYNKKLDFFNRIFYEGYAGCRESNFLTGDFIKNVNKFPIFPYFYNILSGDEYINVINVYNLVADNVGDLETALLSKSSVIRQKITYDFIPTSINDIIRYAAFQYAYVSNISDLYNKQIAFRSFMFERSYRNFFSNLYNDRFCSMGKVDSVNFENHSFIFLYALRNYLFTLMGESCNLSSKLLLYLTYFNQHGPNTEKINHTVLSNSFSSFIAAYKNTMAGELIDLISKSIYNCISLSNYFKEQIVNIIKSKLDDLPAAFNTYIAGLPSNFGYQLCGDIVDLLYSSIACNVLANIYNNNSILSQIDMSSYSQVEEDLFDNYIQGVSNANLESYLFVSYFYKFWHHKFINILPLCLKEYVENVLKPSGVESFSLEQFSTILNRLYDSNPTPDPNNTGEYLFPQSIVNYNTLRTYLVDTVKLSPINYLSQLSNYYNLPKYMCVLFYLELLDNFFNSKVYETYMQDFLETIFVYLRDNGHVDYNYNWYDYHEVADVYLKTYMRYKLVNSDSGDCLFKTFTDNYTNLFNRVITNTTHLYDPFPPSGTYDITINFPIPYEMNFVYSNMITGVTKERMLQFTENMFLSVLTREVIYGAFSYFIM